MTIKPIEHLLQSEPPLNTNVFCYFCSDKDKKAIVSHVLANNHFYKIASDNNLSEVLYLKSDVLSLLKGKPPLEKINQRECSVFYGFCPECDHKLFNSIDNFNGVMTPEKAALYPN